MDDTEANQAGGIEVTPEEIEATLNPQDGAETEEISEDDADELDKLAGLEPETGEPDAVDVEYDGKTYKLPPELKDALLRQSDYTKKTMALANERKAFEAERSQMEEVSRISQEGRVALVNAAALRMQLKDLEDTPIDGLTLEQRNSLILQHQMLEKQVLSLEEQVKQAEAKERDMRSQQFAKARETVVSETAKHIANFNDQRRTELEAFAVTLGATPEFVQQIVDPLVYKTLHLADIGQKFIDRQRKAKNVTDAQQAQPAAQVSGKARGAKDPSKFSPAEMAKHLGYAS